MRKRTPGRMLIRSVAVMLAAALMLSPARAIDVLAQLYLDAVFGPLKMDYWRSEHIDWAALDKRAAETARDAKTPEDTYPAIRELLEILADPEIVFHGADEWRAVGERRKSGSLGIRLSVDGTVTEVIPGSPAARVGLRLGDVIEAVDGAPLAFDLGGLVTEGPSVSLSLDRGGEALEFTIQKADVSFERPILAGRLGPAAYLELPRNGDTGTFTQRREATEIQAALRTLEASGACGWVLDLRRNQRDLVAQLTGLAPILGATEFGGFLKSSSPFPWTYDPQRGRFTDDGESTVSVNRRPFVSKHPLAPVAVLIDRFGEDQIVAVAFVGRANTRLFGQPSATVPRGGHTFGLSDGATLEMPTAWVRDRAGTIYNQPLQPDERLETDWASFGTKRDPVIARALEWLKAQPACK